jgi:ubiquitin carboxyl-terminal hydrolase 4/11
VKKRKLAQSNSSGDPSQHNPLPKTHSDEATGSGQTLLASSRTSPYPSSHTASPPRYLPPHLHEEVLDASTHSKRRPSIDSTTSSPSEAYAGLSLQDKMSGTVENEASAEAASSPDDQRNIDTIRAPPRAASPAKRPASDMDGFNDSKLEQGGGGAPNSPLASRHMRSGSVEMTDSDRMPTAETTSTTTSSSHPGSTTSITSYATNSPSTLSNKTDPDPSTRPSNADAIPSLDDQYNEVLMLLAKDIDDGSEGYVISTKWLARVLSRTSDGLRDHSYEKEAREGEIGPIDNDDIVPEGTFP